MSSRLAILLLAVSLLLCLFSAPHALATPQQNANGPVPTPTAALSPPAATPTADADFNDANATTNNTNACQGVSLGTFLILSPNQTIAGSRWIVGEPMSISWKYTVTTTQIPKNVTVYLQFQQVANLPWVVLGVFDGGSLAKGNLVTQVLPNLSNGQYRIKLVADGKDQTKQLQPGELPPCVSDGQVLAQISRTFSVANKAFVDTFGDPFAPNTSAGLSLASGMLTAFVCLAFCLLRL